MWTSSINISTLCYPHYNILSSAQLACVVPTVLNGKVITNGRAFKPPEEFPVLCDNGYQTLYSKSGSSKFHYHLVLWTTTVSQITMVTRTIISHPVPPFLPVFMFMNHGKLVTNNCTAKCNVTVRKLVYSYIFIIDFHTTTPLRYYCVCRSA